MKEKVGIVATVISTILGILVALSPERVENLRLDFGLFIVRQIMYEICIILFIGLLLLFYKPLKRKLLSRVWQLRPKFSTFTLKQKIVSIPLIILTIIISLPIISWTLFNSVKAMAARKYFYQDLLYRSYRQELIKEGMKKEQNGQSDKAIIYYRQITQLFPNDPRNNYIVQNRISRIERKFNYAKDYFERSKNLEKNQHFNRESFLLLVEALRLDPTDEFIRNEVAQKLDKIKTAKDIPAKFYKAYIAKEQNIASQIFDEWFWYLFEDYFTQEFRTGLNPRKLNVERDFEFIRKLSLEEFEKAVMASWELEKIQKILDQSNQLSEID